ncbi:MAG: hypothetical protein FWC79_01950 [Oscillospiraceae bacterium]|nr:hypothetical protein [Oscillospiraceae bacterium]
MNKELPAKIEEIQKRKRLPAEASKSICKKIYIDYAVGIITLIYFIYIILASMFLVQSVFEVISRVSTFTILALAITAFEISYRKNELKLKMTGEDSEKSAQSNGSGRLAMYGIELMGIATFTLFIPHILKELAGRAATNIMLLAIFVVVYYCITKSIFVYKYRVREYERAVSDITEIIKKEPKRKKKDTGKAELSND